MHAAGFMRQGMHVELLWGNLFRGVHFGKPRMEWEYIYKYRLENETLFFIANMVGKTTVL
jgi:hypothetical protein